MAVMSDNGGAVLAFTTRLVDGAMPELTTKFDAKSKKNVTEAKDDTPFVVVFFPNKSVHVMSAKVAEAKGFLQQPDILGFEQVTDAKTAAGQYKFSMTTRQRAAAWQMMEDQLIAMCISRNGMPLPVGVTYSPTSMWSQDDERIAS